MKRILIAYATREGQTRKIAGHLASTLGGQGRIVECCDVKDVRIPLDWSHYGGCIVAASVHRGKHEREMVAFVREHARDLERIPTAFVSVGMHEATAEDDHRTAAERESARQTVDHQIEGFFAETGWRTSQTKAVAGSLAYRQYGWLLRFVMKALARSGGASTDTSTNHEYTNWGEVETFAVDFHRSLGDSPAATPPAR